MKVHAGSDEPLGHHVKSTCSGNMQLLGDLGDACAPFARPLARIRDELARAVFSEYYTSDDGTLALKQLPYFAVVARLESEKAHLLADRDALRLVLKAKEVGSPP